MPRKVRTEFSKQITDALALMKSDAGQAKLRTWMTNSKNRLSITTTCQSLLNYHRYRFLSTKFKRQNKGVPLHPKCMAHVHTMINVLEEGEKLRSEQTRLTKAARQEQSGDDSASHSASAGHADDITNSTHLDTSADESTSCDWSATQQHAAEQADIFAFNSGEESDEHGPATMSCLTPRPAASSTPLKAHKRKRTVASPIEPLFQSPADVTA